MLALVRRGTIDPAGCYFSIEGSNSSYSDSVQDGRGQRYSLADAAKIADTRDPETARRLIEETLKHPNLGPDETSRLSLELTLIGNGIDYLLFDETPMSSVARRLGYDAVRVVENDDFGGAASSIFVMNTGHIKASIEGNALFSSHPSTSLPASPEASLVEESINRPSPYKTMDASTSPTEPLTLKEASKLLEQAKHALSGVCRNNHCKIIMTEAERREAAMQICAPTEEAIQNTLKMINTEKDHEAWGKLYYCEQPKKLQAHVTRLAKDFPEQAAAIQPFVPAVLAAIEQVDAARAVEKAEMEQRRAARAEKAAKKTSLGVDLAQSGGIKATEATYHKIKASLADIKKRLKQALAEQQREEINAWSERVNTHAGDLTKAFPLRDRREIVPGRTDLPMGFHRFFDVSRGAWPNHNVTTGKLKGESVIAPIIEAIAEEGAEATVSEYAAKLTGKVDTEAEGAKVTEVKVSPVLDVWRYSSIAVKLDDGSTQEWHTQVIINRSVLGKAFNQWPTRLASKNGVEVPNTTPSVAEIVAEARNAQANATEEPQPIARDQAQQAPAPTPNSGVSRRR